ncbi:Metastasis-associated protein MTA1 [Nibea albiflora]|uniref:Metastasis-associated protein MTA1 n=1 Tax=Nibea albiflora TaxID=240163 RepID=A0ACB7F4K6_NIBAL|nr:Metastasis-associated protein MTA1 [Nibea albiflora]
MATVNGAGPGAYHAAGGGRACESCYTMQSAQWYSWGPPNMQCRLCVSCWMYWKKYGGLKMPSRAEGPEERTSPSPASNHNGRNSGSGSTRGGVMIRKRRPNWIDAPDDSFFLVTRETRRLLSRSQLRHACRQPCEQITLRRVSQGPPQGLVLAPPHPHPSLRMRGPIVIHD